EDGVWLDVDGDDHVAGLPAAAAGLALAAQPDLLPVVDPGGDLDVHRAPVGGQLDRGAPTALRKGSVAVAATSAPRWGRREVKPPPPVNMSWRMSSKPPP